jgi:LemA protein
MEVLIVLFVVVFLFPIVFVFAQYNGMVGLRNHIRDAWANIDTELKRRHDLIPNLVATVKGYAAHEREVLQQVVELRNRCLNHQQPVATLASEESQLTAALQRLMVVVENYPQLKADQNFLQLQQELVNTEDRIQSARRFYNGNVRDYRNRVQYFPGNLVAKMFGFGLEEYFDAEPEARSNPQIRLD